MMAGRGLHLKTIRIALSVVLSFAAALDAPAQSYQVRTFTETDGLCSSVVQALAQDAMGQIWFAARGGISVFDGSAWTSYIRGRDLPCSNVMKLIIDENGTVWAWADNTEEYLLKYAAGRWTTIPRPAFASRPIRPTDLAAFGPPGGETVLLGTRDHGLLAWEAGRWSAVDSRSGLPTNTVYGFVVDGPSPEPVAVSTVPIQMSGVMNLTVALVRPEMPGTSDSWSTQLAPWSGEIA